MADELASVDLNLMVCLRALLQEQHVTRAADAVGMSQPAMSNALGRLRRLLGDELLVRVGRLEPTTKAKQLVRPLQEALAILEQQVVQAGRFDPGEKAFLLSRS